MPSILNSISNEQADQESNREPIIKVRSHLRLALPTEVATPSLSAQLNGDFEDVGDSMVDDHEDVEDEDTHHEDVGCDKCISSVDD